jgi:hypothetical protein
MATYPDPPPPLLPVLDAAGIWTPGNIGEIETARDKLRRRFPQFRFHICTVMMPRETILPVFGFWLLNVCPLHANETEEDRAWTVLLLINARTGQAAVVPGYHAERWLSDDDWSKALAAMDSAWKAGKSAGAVLSFFAAGATLLDQSWKLRGSPRSRKSRS